MTTLEQQIQSSLKQSLILRSSSYEELKNFLPSTIFESNDILQLLNIDGSNNAAKIQINPILVKSEEKSEQTEDEKINFIKNDEIQDLREKAGMDNFHFDQIFKTYNAIGEENDMSFLELCNQYGAQKCFDFFNGDPSSFFLRNDQMSIDNWGPLEYAASNGLIQNIRSFIEKGIPITQLTIGIAGLMHENETLNWMLNFYNGPLNIALIKTIISNNIEGVLSLIKAGANVNIPNDIDL